MKKEYIIKVKRTIEFNTVVESENDEEAKLEALKDFYKYLLTTGYAGVDEIEIKQTKGLNKSE